MFTTKSFRHLVWGALVLGASHAQGQATVLGNSGASTNFLGWDNIGPNNFPLQVRHDLNFPIDFYTNARFRMRINERIFYTGLLNNFTNLPMDGFALITPSNLFQASAPRGPFSRLHLAEGQGDNMQNFGYRDWQVNGVTFTGNGDHGYLGQKYNADDETDMVVTWSDNPGNWKGDKLRFIFTSEYDPLVFTGMNSKEGLEAMRFFPVDR